MCIYSHLLEGLKGGRHDGLERVEPLDGNGIHVRLEDGQFIPCVSDDTPGDGLFVEGDPTDRAATTRGLLSPTEEERWNVAFSERGDTSQMDIDKLESMIDETDIPNDEESCSSEVSDEDYGDGSPYHTRQPYDLTIERSLDPSPECEVEYHQQDWLLDSCACEYRTPDDYEFIRRLSQVSATFTRELGACLWTGATLEIREPEAFLFFVRDHPAALPLIRAVVLRLRCDGDWGDECTTTIDKICHVVSERMNPKFFVVCIGSEPVDASMRSQVLARRVKSDIETAVKDKLYGEWKEVIRNFNFRGSFILRLVPHYYLPDLDLTEHKKLEHEVGNLWMPDTVRKARQYTGEME
jgi:hypothetical protein